MDTDQPLRGRPQLRATKIVAGMAAIFVLLALLQRTGLALFPPRHDDTILGAAAGAVFGTLVIWVLDRRK